MAHEPTPALCFDSSALILFLNDALPAPVVAVLQECLQEQQAFISAIVRAEVLAWSKHTATSLVTANGKDFRRVPGLNLSEI